MHIIIQNAILQPKKNRLLDKTKNITKVKSTEGQ